MSLSVVLIILAMLILNGFFAAYELALASIRTARLRALVDQKRPGAVIALRMKNRMEGSLAVVQLGITVVGAIAAATGGASVDEWFTPIIEQNLGTSHRLSSVPGPDLLCRSAVRHDDRGRRVDSESARAEKPGMDLHGPQPTHGCVRGRCLSRGLAAGMADHDAREIWSSACCPGEKPKITWRGCTNCGRR